MCKNDAHALLPIRVQQNGFTDKNYRARVQERIQKIFPGGGGVGSEG